MVATSDGVLVEEEERGAIPIVGVVCLEAAGRSLVVMVEEEESVGDRRGMVPSEVSLLGGIILMGDWRGLGCATVPPLGRGEDESTNNGGGGGLLVSMGSSLSEESEDPEPDPLLLLPLEEDPLLLEELVLFPLPFPPMADGFLSESLTAFAVTEGRSLGGSCC